MPVQPVPLAPHSPGIKTARIQRGAHRIVPGGVPDVVELSLPSVAELMLNAEGPLDGIGRLGICCGIDDVLRLGEEQRREGLGSAG